jgi:hypothetical protein
MPPKQAPYKTAEGQAEMAQRTRQLSQRHRTVLLMVDGRRSLAELQALALQSGVPQGLDELLAWGLVAMPPDDAPPLPPAARVAAAPPVDSMADESLLPSVRSLAPESSWTPLDPAAASAESAAPGDRPLEEARDLLLRAVRAEAPVTGSITMLKLRRAGTRAELAALLDEVEQRIRKPRRLIIAAQTLRHVRHLLSLPAGNGPPVAS